MPTPLVRIRLGSDWEKHVAGDVVRKDARRGAWIIENIPGSEPADKGSAASLGIAWPLVERGVDIKWESGAEADFADSPVAAFESPVGLGTEDEGTE